MNRKLLTFVAAGVIAVLGATMVLLYVKSHSGAQTVASRGTEVKVLTATGIINAGETAGQAQSEGKLALRNVPAEVAVPGSLTSIDAMTSMVAVAPIYPGEQILSAMFGTSTAAHQALNIPKGMVAVSVELTDPGRVAGFVTPGSRVAIFVAYTGGTSGAGGGGFAKVVVPTAEVLAVGPTTLLSGTAGASTTADNSDVGNTILTVALTEQEADATFLAAKAGTVSFGLLGRDMPTTPDPGAGWKVLS